MLLVVILKKCGSLEYITLSLIIMLCWRNSLFINKKLFRGPIVKITRRKKRKSIKRRLEKLTLGRGNSILKHFLKINRSINRKIVSRNG